MTPAQRAQQENRNQAGQYRHRQHAESDTTLTPPTARPKPGPDAGGGSASRQGETGVSAVLAGRHQLLSDNGYTPAGFWLSARNPDQADHARTWWDQAHATAEYDPEDGYPAIPEDWTPSGTGGNSVAGRRLTTTRSYTGGGVTVRMPSATAVRHFADTVGSTFRVPVEASTETRSGRKTVTCWVTCTRHGPGNWTVTPQGVTGHTGAQTSEAVASVLEARRPTTALAEAGDLIDKHRNRAAATGTRMRSPGKSWIQKLGYNPAGRLLVMQSATGTYGYQADPDEYQHVLDATGDDGDHIGSRFNKLIKADRQRARHPVTRCTDCGRIHRADSSHRCPNHTRPDRSLVRHLWEKAYRRRGAKALEQLAA